MQLIDISQPVYHGCPNCPVHPPVETTLVATHPNDGWHLEKLSLAIHTGSHLDAPLHKLADGGPIDSYPLNAFTGPAVILDVRGLSPKAPIDSATLKAAAAKPAVNVDGKIVLLNTGWGDRRAADQTWHYDSPFLAPDGARYLAERRIKGVGIDHYSIGGSTDPDNSSTHDILLSRRIWILEDLRFPPEAMAAKQPVTLWALPINLPGASGSFCRPVLAVEDEERGNHA